MKKIILVIMVLALASIGYADDITLNSTHVLQSPDAVSIGSWQIININARTRELQVRYKWLDSLGNTIKLNNISGWNYWTCRDVSQGDNARCASAGVPWACCTAEGAGTCPEVVSTCFSDVFDFIIRAQDVGTKIGVGLRNLIWNRMKQDILTGGNDGTFQQQ